MFGNRAVEQRWSQFNDRSVEVTVKAHEILTQFRTVRSFDAEFREYKQYRERLERMHSVVCETATIHGVKQGLSLASL
jgi:ABC-type transport system involved in Fe-S cluster assembly fused permease/ATPase subunit